MKRKIFTLLTLLLTVVGGAKAADFVDTYGAFGTVTGSYIGSGISKIALGDNASANSGIQASSNGATLKFTVSTPTGFTIKSVRFKDSNVDEANIACDDAGGTLSTASHYTTLTASASKSSIEFTIPSSASNKQAKLTEFVVTVSSSTTDDYELITPSGAIAAGAIPFTSSLGDDKLVTAFAPYGGTSSASAGNVDFGNGKGVSITTSRAIKAIYTVWYQRAPSNDSGWTGKDGEGSAIGTYSCTTNAWTASDANTKFVSLVRGESSTAKLSAIHIFYYPNAASYDITWANGGRGTAPTSPTSGSIITLPTMDPVGSYTNTGWKANQIVKVGDDNVAANTEIAVGSIVTVLQATTFTGVWKANSDFALTSADEVEVNIGGTSTITTSGAVAVPTYTSGDESVATVSSAGVITAVAGGKTTITVTDPGNEDVMGKSVTVTVLVPYPNPAAADSYVLNQDTYAFSNKDNTKYYFTNGFTMTPNTAASLDNGGLAKSKKYSHARNYTIKTPSNVTVRYAVITARNNYKNENSNPAATWGTVFGTDYSSEGNLPWSNEDPVEKDFTVPSPFAGKSLEFQPGGNQWQAIINLYTITYHSKYAVSFDKGEGTGSMEGTEVRGGSTYILPASTFTAPANKGFAGWLCDIDGLVYDAGENYTMTDAATTFTAQYAGVEGQMIIRATPTATNAATVTGAVSGTADVNLQDGGSDGWKFGGNTHHIGITLASGWTFKAGDIINVHITKVQDTGGEIIFYNSDKSVIYDTDDAGVEGDNRYVLSDAFEGKTAIYLYRLTASNNWNAYIDYIEVTRPLSLVSVTIGATGWSTYSNAEALDFANAIPAGLNAYMVTGFSGTALTRSDALNNAPAGTGLLLNGTAGETYTIPVLASSSTVTTSNKMVASVTGGTVAAGTGSTVNYVLMNNSGSPEFQWIGSTSATLGANKAYLALDGGPKPTPSAPGLWFDFGNEGETTGINAVKGAEFKVNGEYYNLAGQRVAQPTKGLYIVNGRKVVIK